MGDLKVSATAPVQAPLKAPAKAESTLSKHLGDIKKAAFSDTGAAILAGAASGALIGGLPGAAAGGLVGLGMAAYQKGSTGAAVFSGTAALGIAAVSFPPVGALLVGASAWAFASGKAQEAAGKLGAFLNKHEQKAEAKPAAAQ